MTSARCGARAIAAAAGLAALLPSSALTQATGWSARADASASLFFGNTEQTLVTTRQQLAHTDSVFELKSDIRFTYGEAQVDGQRGVTRRAWNTTLTFDHQPFARVSPFALASFESSFERRIAARYSAGLGAKLVLTQTERSRASFSLAALAEETRFPDPALAAGTQTRLFRWSARLRGERDITDRVRLTHETFYRPEVEVPQRFTLSTSSTAAYRLGRVVNLTFSFLANHDSEARARGARSNSDGQMVFGVQTVFQ